MSKYISPAGSAFACLQYSVETEVGMGGKNTVRTSQPITLAAVTVTAEAAMGTPTGPPVAFPGPTTEMYPPIKPPPDWCVRLRQKDSKQTLGLLSV